MATPIPFADMPAADQARAIDDMARRLVAEDVRYCVSSLIHGLSRVASGLTNDNMATLGIEYEDLIAVGRRAPDEADYRDAWEYHPDKARVAVHGAGDCWEWCLDDDDGASEETELAAWQQAFAAAGFDDPDGSEVYEHWIVTPYLAARLREHGETVVDDLAGLTVWGRATTGQAIYIDGVIQRIARDILEA